MYKILSFFSVLALLISLSLMGDSKPAFSQSSIIKKATESSDTPKSPALPQPLTRNAIRDVLSSLSDVQVRELLIKELDKQVAQKKLDKGKVENKSTMDVVIGWGKIFINDWVHTIRSAPKIPAAFSQTFSEIERQRGDASVWRIPAVLLASLIGGLLAAYAFGAVTKKRRESLLSSNPETLWQQILIVGGRFAAQGVQLLVFVLTAYLIDSILNSAHPVDSTILYFIVGGIGWTTFAIISARFVLSPHRPDLRLCSVDCFHAKFLTRRIGLIFGFSAFFIGALSWLAQFNWPYGEVRLGAWVSTGFHGLIALTFWQGRKGITQIVLGHEEDASPGFRKFAEVWPLIAIGLTVLQWLVIELIVATGNIASLSPFGVKFALVVLIMAPIFRLIVQALVKATWPVDPDQDSAMQEAHRQTQAGIIRFGRIVLGAVIIVLFAKAWNIDLRDLASQGVGSRIAGAFVEVFLIGVVAYGLWELMNIIADRQIALDRVAAGPVDEEEESGHGGDGPGGKGGSRLGTLMPLIRGSGQVVIVIMAVLAILGQLGINVTPLLAGAGIVGMAVAFGAQTLVKDIFSGIFFLIDDAFRKGEYLDVGSAKGSVEKISVRSMQLRHHNGPLNTIPFGSIDQLTNFSRDWAIMKLSLRLTYDTDANKVRKMIKNLGQELLEHPEIGPLFLEPLKSQGVRSMEDSAMIMRIKFTTKPGDQFTIRRFVLDEIRKLFDANGIKFANREVTVHLAGEKDNLTHEQKQAVGGVAASTVAAAQEGAAKQETDKP